MNLPLTCGRAASLAQFAVDAHIDLPRFAIVTPFPGTALHRRLQQSGRLLADRGWPYYTLFDVTYQPDRLSRAELEIGFRDLLQVVYSSEMTTRRSAIRKRILRQRSEAMA